MSDVRRRLADAGPPLVVAHRGAWQIAGPENSRAAIQAASAFDMVEIDVRLSADMVPFVMHDQTIDRTTERGGAVSDMTARELQSVRLQDSTETIPTLHEALFLGGNRLLFDIDVKEPAELEAVSEFMARHPVRHRSMLKIDVQKASDIERLKALQARGDICVIAKTLLRTEDDLAIFETLKSENVAGAEVWFANITLLRNAVELGPPLTSYTLKDVHCSGLSDELASSDAKAVWGTLCNAGLRAVMTDLPGPISIFLEEA